ERLGPRASRVIGRTQEYLFAVDVDFVPLLLRPVIGLDRAHHEGLALVDRHIELEVRERRQMARVTTSQPRFSVAPRARARREPVLLLVSRITEISVSRIVNRGKGIERDHQLGLTAGERDAVASEVGPD